MSRGLQMQLQISRSDTNFAMWQASGSMVLNGSEEKKAIIHLHREKSLLH
jgi:hypothetical protein